MVDIAKIATGADSVLDAVGRLSTIGSKALPVLRIVSDFVPIPFMGAVVDALAMASPYLEKAGQIAPIMEKAIDAGVPIAVALQQHGPDLLDAFKHIYAIGVNADPTRPQTNMTAADVSDDVAVAYAASSFRFAGKALFGQRWTDEQYERAWAHQSHVTDVS